jgi:anaphase-promoting complex subunit 3
MIFFRTQRLPLADYHFQQALAINPRSSALHTYRGMVASKLGRHGDAFEAFELALKCNSGNVLARSHLAQTLIAQGEIHQGMKLVDTMLQSAPREAFLHFLKASACAKLGEKEDALVHYTTAMDLDSKNGPLIKTRIDRIFANPLLGEQGEGDSLLDEEFDI